MIDAMGGDHSPAEIVKGAVQAAQNSDINIILVGREDAVSGELANYSYDTERIEILNASQVITPDEAPVAALRQKKDSSIAVGLAALKEGRAGAFVSAGSTGALLAGATLTIGRITGISRPALATLLPNDKGFSFLLDAGANVDAKPQYLLQFAQMGSVYMENIMGIANPRVALVNIGTEKEKGNALTKEAYELLETSNLNFIGNIEARDIPFGAADVIICDAFVGNIILKYTEGFAEMIFGMLMKEDVPKSTLYNLKKGFDYTEVGGAPFLGLNALVVKAHGASNAKAIAAAIAQCAAFIEKDIVEKIAASLRPSQ